MLLFPIQELKSYLKQNGGKPIFDEENRNVMRNNAKTDGDPMERLSVKTLGHLANLLISFIEYKFENPKRDDIINVCQCALNLLTSIGALVCLFTSMNLKCILHSNRLIRIIHIFPGNFI